MSSGFMWRRLEDDVAWIAWQRLCSSLRSAASTNSPQSYEFPGQYLKYFEKAGGPGPLFAILYEPRGDAATGRMKYVGWAEIAGPPVPSTRTTASGRPLFIVRYVKPAR